MQKAVEQLSTYLKIDTTNPPRNGAESVDFFFRAKGINAYGVFPAMISLENLKMVHRIDERISEENLVKGSAI
ncbi:MAG: hypothetical protein HQ517_16850 [SAR324 cluster bacterium]|nr:hypothetical protein [SAR324 cluster bacterium]